jgi:ankyrin repeat protein
LVYSRGRALEDNNTPAWTLSGATPGLLFHTSLAQAASSMKPFLIVLAFLIVAAAGGVGWYLALTAAPPRRDDTAARLAAMREAAEKGHISRVRDLLGSGAHVNDRDEHGETALMWAASAGQRAVVVDLLAWGADPTLKDDQGRTAQARATAAGHAEVAQVLADPAAAIAKVDDAARRLAEARRSALARDYDNSILELVDAVDAGKVSLVAKLLERGPIVNDCDHEGRTPLMHAAARGDLAMLALLLTNGATVDNIDPKGRTALMQAAEQGRFGAVMLLSLGRVPADKRREVLQNLGLTADQYKNLPAVVSDINLQDQKGQTALMVAAKKGQADLIQFLLAHGADRNLRDGAGNTALLLASQAGKRDAAGLLAHYGTNFSDAALFQTNNLGQTPLMLAAAGGHGDLVPLLTDLGPLGPRWQRLGELTQAKDSAGKTALSYADASGDAATAKMLHAYAEANGRGDDGLTPLLQAAAKGDAPTVRLLLQRGADPEAKDKDGRTPLMLAAARGHVEVEQVLLKYFIGDATFSTKNPDHHRAYLGYVNLRDSQGRTALMQAAAAGQLATAELLMDHLDFFDGINALPDRGHRMRQLKLTDPGGKTAQQLAAQAGHEKVADYLLRQVEAQ